MSEKIVESITTGEVGALREYFNEAISNKIIEALEFRKIELAQGLFEPVDEEYDSELLEQISELSEEELLEFVDSVENDQELDEETKEVILEHVIAVTEGKGKFRKAAIAAATAASLAAGCASTDPLGDITKQAQYNCEKEHGRYVGPKRDQNNNVYNDSWYNRKNRSGLSFGQCIPEETGSIKKK